MFWISYGISFVVCSVIGVAILLCRLAAGAALSLLRSDHPRVGTTVVDETTQTRSPIHTAVLQLD